MEQRLLIAVQYGDSKELQRDYMMDILDTYLDVLVL
jgi:hypothetical protein